MAQIMYVDLKADLSIGIRAPWPQQLPYCGCLWDRPSTKQERRSVNGNSVGSSGVSRNGGLDGEQHWANLWRPATWVARLLAVVLTLSAVVDSFMLQCGDSSGKLIRLLIIANIRQDGVNPLSLLGCDVALADFLQ